MNLHLVSDATGETLNAVARATTVQFEHAHIIYHRWSLIRTRFQLHRVLEGIEAEPGPVLSTLVDKALRTDLQTTCERLNVPIVNVLDPVMEVLQEHIGEKAAARPGKQYVLNADYFRRIDAMHFVLAHDDGQAQMGISEADVVLVGVSRSSKTPTCFYLANRGIKAANIPLVPGTPGAAGPRRSALSGDRADRGRQIADRDPPPPAAADRCRRADRAGAAGSLRLRGRGGGEERAALGPPALHQPRLAGHRRHPPLDRGNRRHRAAADRWLARTPAQDAGTGRAMIQAEAPPLILASESASRRALLQSAGIAFTTRPAHVDETSVKQAAKAEGASAADVATLLSELKAGRVSAHAPDAIVIGADQLLVCGDAWFDKPASPAEARRQLAHLRGRTHVLVTATVCLRNSGRLWHHVAEPRMTMRAFSDAFLDDYIAAEGEALTRTVGAYRLEGRGVHLFDRIEGEHAAILGLPLLPLFGFLRQHGVLGT